MRFKKYILEGRNPWMLFSISRGELDKKWVFKNLDTGKLYYIKITPGNQLTGIQAFLKDILATPGILPKTQGEIDYHSFASQVLSGEKYTVYVKSGKFLEIKDKWILD